MGGPPDPTTLSLPTLGILGGGQLARMTALAAARLGVPVRVLTDHQTGTSRALADVTVADWTDPFVLQDWVAGCDAVTVESEWAPADRLQDVLPPGVEVHPDPGALVVVRHKGRQRARYGQAGLPQPDHVWAETAAQARDAVARFGAAVLKRFEGSYDGYGNATVRSPDDVAAAWNSLAAPDAGRQRDEPGGLLVEAWVPFQAEAAVTVARTAGGASAVYPAVRSEHRDHRLWAATVPAGFSDETEAAARETALATVGALGLTGVATVELFVTDRGRVLVNEVAPRPHNTAHLTLDAHHTSQFENHVRAVLGWPLGEPGLRVPAACMVNVLAGREGRAEPDLAAALAVPGASVHLYGKDQARPERKMGHVTVTAGSADSARQRAEAAAAAVSL